MVNSVLAIQSQVTLSNPRPNRPKYNAPVDLTTKLAFRFKASSIDNLADAAEVTNWPLFGGAKTEAALNVFSATPSKRPTLRKNQIGSFSAVKFIASAGQYIQSAQFATAIPMPFTEIILARRTILGVSQTFTSGGVVGGVSKYFSMSAGSSNQAMAGAGTTSSELQFAGVWADTNWHVMVTVFDGSNSGIYFDGVPHPGPLGVTTPANAVLPRLTLGASSSTTSAFQDGYTTELMGFQDRVFSAYEAASVSTQLKAAYGLS